MFIVWRWWYFLGIAGIVLVAWGAVETKHASASGSEPIDVEVAALQRGEAGSQPYVRIGAHVALFGHATGWGDEDDDRLDWAIYPIVASDDPYLQARTALEERYPNPDDIPEGAYPVLEGCKVFVLTERWATVNDMIGGSEMVGSLEGLLFKYEDLEKDEAKVLRSLDPSADLASVWLLEDGRRPRPLWLCLVLGVVGVLMIGQAVRLFRGPKAKAKGEEQRRELEAEDAGAEESR